MWDSAAACITACASEPLLASSLAGSSSSPSLCTHLQHWLDSLPVVFLCLVHCMKDRYCLISQCADHDVPALSASPRRDVRSAASCWAASGMDSVASIAHRLECSTLCLSSLAGPAGRSRGHVSASCLCSSCPAVSRTCTWGTQQKAHAKPAVGALHCIPVAWDIT